MLASTLDEYSWLLCFLFPPFYTRLLRPYDGAQEPDASVDDDSYYTGSAYYYVQADDDDQE